MYSSVNLLHFIFIDVNIFIFNHTVVDLLPRIVGILLHLQIMVLAWVPINNI